jgi:hypothetical protein
MSLSQRAVIAPLVTVATVAALVFGTGALSASADPVAPTVASGVIDNPLLTLPLTDGFNDASTLTITTSSSSDITLNSTGVFDGPSATPLKDTADSNYTATFNLASLDPAAGDYALDFTQDATPFVGPDLTVGTGQATNVTVEPAASPFFVDSSIPTKLATVTAEDETGTALPISAGAWTLTQGTTTATGTVPSTGIISTPTLTGFAVGHATLTVTGVAGPDGSVTKDADPTDITLATTSVIGLTIARSVPTVYPSLDGFRDSVAFRLRVVTDNPEKALPFTGTVVIKKGTKVVKSIAVRGITVVNAVWNGRVGTKIVTGTYSVTASVTSIDGAAHASTTVVVSKKKLHHHTKSVTVSANSFFSNSHNADSSTKGTNGFSSKFKVNAHTTAATAGSCALHGKSLYCSSTGDGESDRFGFMSVPRNISASAALKPYSAHLTMTVTEQVHTRTSGPLYIWGGEAGPIGGDVITKTGSKVTSTSHFGTNDTELAILISTFGTASVHISKVKASYSYYTLS